MLVRLFGSVMLVRKLHPQNASIPMVVRQSGSTTEKERLERVIIDGQKHLAEIEERIAVGDNRRELIEQYTNLEHLTREIVEILIDYIVIGKRIPGTKDVPIEIHWNF